MTLTTLALAIIYGVLITSINTKKSVEAFSMRDRALEGLYRRMMLELKSIPSYSGQNSLIGVMGQSSPRQDRVDFITASDPLYAQGTPSAFSSALSPQSTPAYVHEVGYYINTDEDGKTWLQRREEDGTDFNLLEGGVARKVLEDLDSFEISYYQNEQWETQWQQRELPPLIKVKITFRDEIQSGSESENLPGHEFVIPLIGRR